LPTVSLASHRPQLGKNMVAIDTLWETLTDHHIKTPMGVTGENLAEQYEITREECDAFAVASHQKWAAAQAKGTFAAEMAPIELKSRKGVEVRS
jgi:acetyl-CoA acyltransferase 2